MKPQELNIESEIFDDLREKFDMTINALMRNLIAKSMREGTLTIKIKVLMDEITTADGEIQYMPAFEPKINMKINAKGDIELDKIEGLLLKDSGDGRHVIGTSQISMDELIEELNPGNKRQYLHQRHKDNLFIKDAWRIYPAI